MQSVVKSLNTLMDNLHTYSILQGKTGSLDMMKVSFSTILEMAIDDIVTGDELVRADRIHYSMENTEDYIYGDPYYLMQDVYKRQRKRSLHRFAVSGKAPVFSIGPIKPQYGQAALFQREEALAGLRHITGYRRFL